MERIEKLNAFLAENPGDSFLKHALALEWIKAGDDEKAREIFEDILTLDPAYVGSYYHLAQLHERNARSDEAALWYKKGIAAALKAGDGHALNELRAAYAHMNDESDDA